MPAQRINPSDVYQPFKNYYTQVVKATGTQHVHVAGTLALDQNRNLVGDGDLVTQVRVIMENIGKSLRAAGAMPGDVVRINIFTVDVDKYRADGHAEVLKFFGNELPASTLVGVTRLADPSYLVEIEATAVIP